MGDRLRLWGSPGSLRSMLLCAALIGTAACSERSQEQASPKSADVVPLLIQHERAAWTKYVARDLEGSRPLLASDYADVQSDGTVLDREGHLAFVPKADVEWHELDRFNAFLLSPDAAVVTYRARSRDRGVAETYQADVTSGWSLRDGRWLNTFYRETPTPPEASPAGE